MPEIRTVESMQGDRLHDYSAHTEYVREFLSPEEQDLLRTADQLEAQAFDAIGLMGEYGEQREIALANDFISGHPDLMRIYSESHFTVILDRKFGWAEVEKADVNLQLRVYAILAPTRDIFAGILQPRARYAERVTIARYNVDSKTAAQKQIAAIVKASEKPDAPLHAGEWCRYCKARMICPELKEAVTKELVLLEDLSPEPLSRDLSKRAMTARIEAKLSIAKDEQLESLYDACGKARFVNDPLNDEIRRRIAKGGMKNFELGVEYDVRSIANPRKAASLLVLSGNFTREEILEQTDLPIGRVQSKYREKTGASEKQAKADLNKILEPVIEKEPRKARILRKKP